ncbi:hypothetical protein [Pseudothioclava arenosa]|uniref:hypothetical protein n=1 Tax=Pseudothioclava arenosa TaxID=1795308 RepID=UPI0011807187|nr:hypothetical protein [Pseudothioclava arenosa]
MKAALISLVFLAAFAGPVVALEPGGTISGAVDGQPVEAALWAGQSDYDDYGTGGTGGSISLMAADLLPAAGFGTTAIGIEASNFANGPYYNVTVIVLSKTEQGTAYYAELESGLVWTPEEMRFDGEMMAVSGTLEGTLTRGPLYSRERDASVTMPMSLRVEAVVPRIE